MSAHTCCHIPPVQFSAGQNGIKLNYTNLDGTGLNWTSLNETGQNKRVGNEGNESWDGAQVNAVVVSFGGPGYSKHTVDEKRSY